MNAETALAEAYQEWRDLAETEGQAIRSCDWGLLAASQSALTQLRERITALTMAAKTEWVQFGADVAAKEKKIRAIIADLVQLERQNSTLLGALRQGVQTRRDRLDQSGRNLRRLQRSYAPQQPALWTSFS